MVTAINESLPTLPTQDGVGRPLCTVCQIRYCVKQRSGNYGTKCHRCYTDPEKFAATVERKRLKRHPWSKYKKDYCEVCRFVASHPVQLDVDHIDGNRENNDPSNFQTLCANCHRLKTHLNKENRPYGNRTLQGVYEVSGVEA